MRETPPRELPWGKPAAGLVIALLLGWGVLGGDRSADADAAPSGPRMSMNLYRAQVQTIEDMLYARGTQAEPDLDGLVAETQRLAATMKESESRLSMTPLILDVSGYADFLVELGRHGFDAGAVEDARLEWERVRTRVFEDDATSPTTAE